MYLGDFPNKNNLIKITKWNQDQEKTTPTKEDLDFIVDDGYRHDVDPDYIPNEKKYLVSGKEFKK